MNEAPQSQHKFIILSVLVHAIVLILLVGFETTEVIRISPPSDDAPIIEASLMLNRSASKSIPKPEPKIIPKPEIKPEIKPEPAPEPEPEILTKNIVEIKTEKKPPKPDKKRENELKKMAEQSLEQAFKQESLQEDLQKDLQKKLQEHDMELKASAAASAAVQSEINQYMTALANKVKRNWRQPIDTNISGLTCIVLIRASAQGDVLDAKVTQSSGNLGFDRSAEIAVRKSSPLPIPKNDMARNQFKQFEFSFNPGA